MGKCVEAPARILAGILCLLFALVGAHYYEASNGESTTAELAERATPSVVVIECYVPFMQDGRVSYRIANTAGFVATDKGHILTVAHGLSQCTKKRQKNIRVRFWEDPGKAYRAVLLRIDEKSDAAILQVPSMPSSVLPLELDLSLQRAGSPAVAIGHPELFYWSVSDGVISADRYWKDSGKHLIQITAPIHPGNSGGPVLNSKGYVIGVVSFYVNDSTLAFIIPIDTFAYLAKGLYL